MVLVLLVLLAMLVIPVLLVLLCSTSCSVMLVLSDVSATSDTMYIVLFMLPSVTNHVSAKLYNYLCF